ncbi:hypothetical protein WJX74_002502 [Apatococcus lobatus]|uniref:Uncharacterized protein n=1 Tax=Apatococcus lobatus TaxID=904363 RepID=A0AAW1RSU1_9CHLO
MPMIYWQYVWYAYEQHKSGRAALKDCPLPRTNPRLHSPRGAMHNVQGPLTPAEKSFKQGKTSRVKSVHSTPSTGKSTARTSAGQTQETGAHQVCNAQKQPAQLPTKQPFVPGADDEVPLLRAAPGHDQQIAKKCRLSGIYISNHPAQQKLCGQARAPSMIKDNSDCFHQPNNLRLHHSHLSANNQPDSINTKPRQLDASRALNLLAKFDEAVEQGKGAPSNMQASHLAQGSSHGVCMRLRRGDGIPSDLRTSGSPLASEIGLEVEHAAAAGMQMDTQIFDNLALSSSPSQQPGGVAMVTGWSWSAPIDTSKDVEPFDVFNLETFPDIEPDDLDYAPALLAFPQAAEDDPAPEGVACAKPATMLPFMQMHPNACNDSWHGPSKLMTAGGQDLAFSPGMDVWEQLMQGSPDSHQTHVAHPFINQQPPAAHSPPMLTGPRLNMSGMQDMHDGGLDADSKGAPEEAQRLTADPPYVDGSWQSKCRSSKAKNDIKAQPNPKGKGKGKGKAKQSAAKTKSCHPAVAHIPFKPNARIYPLQRPPGRDLRVKMYEEQFSAALRHFEDLDASDADDQITHSEAIFPSTALYRATLTGVGTQGSGTPMMVHTAAVLTKAACYGLPAVFEVEGSLDTTPCRRRGIAPGRRAVRAQAQRAHADNKCSPKEISDVELYYECCLDLDNTCDEVFHRLRQLALDGLTLIAQGWACAPNTLSASSCKQPERKPAGIWALTPGVGMYNRPYLMLAEVPLSKDNIPLGLWLHKLPAEPAKKAGPAPSATRALQQPSEAGDVGV